MDKSEQISDPNQVNSLKCIGPDLYTPVMNYIAFSEFSCLLLIFYVEK